MIQYRTLYKVKREYDSEKHAHVEDLKREETIKRIYIPPETLKEIIVETFYEFPSLRYLLFKPFFRILSGTVFALSLIGIIGIVLIASIIFVIPFIVSALFGAYSYFYFKDL